MVAEHESDSNGGGGVPGLCQDVCSAYLSSDASAPSLSHLLPEYQGSVSDFIKSIAAVY